MFKFITRIWNAVVDFFFGKKEETTATPRQEEPAAEEVTQPFSNVYADEEKVSIEEATAEIKQAIMTSHNLTSEEADKVIEDFKTIAQFKEKYVVDVRKRALEGTLEQIKEGSVHYGLLEAVFGDDLFYDDLEEFYYNIK